MKIIKFTNLEETRIDIFLSKELELSRAKIQKLILSDKIKLNNLLVKKTGAKIYNTGIIEILNTDLTSPISLEPWINSNLLDIVYEAEDYLIINKPSNLSVHPGTGNRDKTLVNILIGENITLSSNSERPGIVHRLDKNTSGLMIIAKTDKFQEHIIKQFEDRKVEKEYIAIVDGKMPSSKGIIEAPIGRSQRNRKLMDVTSQNSKNAITTFEVIEAFENNQLVSFKILTGRTHQIRVHSKYVKAPIYNDYEYNKKIEENGQYLHSKLIKFLDLNNEEKIFEINLPDYFQNKINELRKIKENKNVKN